MSLLRPSRDLYVVLLLAIITCSSSADNDGDLILQGGGDNKPPIFGTTGSPCFSNATCTGPNEHCKFQTDFDAPCQQGLCECIPCHALDKNGICSPLRKLQLGDACFGEGDEAIIVEHAACYLGVVSCKSGFTQSGSYCGYDGGYPYMAACSSSYFCAGDLKCLNGSCSCIGGGQYKYDDAESACVFKQLGDYCDFDDDCQIGGTLHIGFAAPERAVCLNNKCSCGSGSRQTSVTYMDPVTGRVKAKQICVHFNSTLGLSYGATCDLDPVIAGSLEDVQVCDEHFACIRCPEDLVDDHKGRCRSSIAPPTPPPVCYERSRQPVQQDAGGIGTLIAAADPGDVIGAAGDAEQFVVTLTSAVSLASQIDTNPDTWSWSDRLMAAAANRTWLNNGWPYRQCSSAFHCYTNEQCLIPNFCRRGVCACIPPNYQDNHQNCLPPPATGPVIATTVVPNDLENGRNGTFVDYNVTSSVDSAEIYLKIPPSNYYYGMECQSVSDCAKIGLNWDSATVLNDGLVQNGLHCLSNGTSGDPATDSGPRFCLCPSAKYKWDKTQFQCREKDFGDSCQADSDCDTGAYTKQSFGGFKCLSDTRTCGCNEPIFTAVTVAVLQAAWGVVMPRNMPLTINRKTYCVASAVHRASITSGGNCTVSLVDESDSATFTCAPGLICLYCPADTIYGMCTNLAKILHSTGVRSEPELKESSAISAWQPSVILTLSAIIAMAVC